MSVRYLIDVIEDRIPDDKIDWNFPTVSNFDIFVAVLYSAVRHPIKFVRVLADMRNKP